MIVDFNDPGFDPEVIFRSVFDFQLKGLRAPLLFDHYKYISINVFEVWSMMVLHPDSDVWFQNGVDMRFYRFTISSVAHCDLASEAINFRNSIIDMLVLSGFIGKVGSDRLFPILVGV